VSTTLEAGLAQIFKGIGVGNEFDATTTPPTPLTLEAIIAAVTGGLQQIIAGVGTSTAPGTVIDALKSLTAGLGTQQQFDCAPYTPQPVGSATAPFGSPTTPTDYNKGTCDESTTGAKPGSAESGAAQIKAVLGILDTGVGQIIAGLGDLAKDGKGVKSVTTKQGKFGINETPNTAIYALQFIQDTFATIYPAFGSCDVHGSTLLNGLQQLSDGMQLAIDGTATGRDGAATVSGVVRSGVVGGDQSAALQNAGKKRADEYPPFVSAPAGANHTTMFLYRMPAIG